MSTKFSFIIPNVNQFEMLFNDCIDSLVRHHQSQDYEIIIVDDGSPKELQSRIESESLKRNIKLIRNETNVGFSRTVNRGLDGASGEYLILVNNDVQFVQNVTEEIERSFESDKKTGIVGALLFYPNGTIQHGGIYALAKGQFSHRGWHRTPDQAPEALRPEYLIGVTGALFAIRRQAYSEIGPFNSEYFLACDDTEYCLRAWQKDWRVFYNPLVRAIHVEGATRGNNDTTKLIKARHWYIKERETFSKFQADLCKFDWSDLTQKVDQANNPTPVKNETETSEKWVFQQPSVSPSKVERKIIAVRRSGALGDVIQTTAVIRQIKQLYPEHDIAVATLCPDVFRDSPHVRLTVSDLRAVPNPDKVFDLDLAYEKRPKQHVASAYAIEALGHDQFDLRPEIFSNDIDYSSLKSKLGSVDLQKQKVAVIHMGVGWKNRTWASEHWNNVAKQLSYFGYRVVVIGRGGDHRAEFHPGLLNLVNHLTIHEIRELMKRASVFVGMDSGMIHVAMTTDVPVVGLFTVANPQYRLIARPETKSIALVPKSECRFCLHEQPAPVTFVACKFGTNACLSEITPSSVIEAIKEVSR